MFRLSWNRGSEAAELSSLLTTFTSDGTPIESVHSASTAVAGAIRHRAPEGDTGTIARIAVALPYAPLGDTDAFEVDLLALDPNVDAIMLALTSYSQTAMSGISGTHLVVAIFCSVDVRLVSRCLRSLA